MAIYSKKNPGYVAPESDRPHIDFCFTDTNHLQLHIPYKVNGGTEYLILERVRQGDSYSYQILIRTDPDKLETFDLPTKEVDGRMVVDATEAHNQTHINVRDARGNASAISINLNRENCQFFDQFMSLCDWGSTVTRRTTAIDGATLNFLDREVNQNVTKIRSHLRCAALTHEYNTTQETPRVMTDPTPRTSPRLFEFDVADPTTGTNRRIRSYLIPTQGGGYFNVEVDMNFSPDVNGRRMPTAYLRDADGTEHPFVFDTRDGNAQIVERYGRTFVSLIPFEDITNPEITHPQPMLLEVPLHGESIDQLRNLVHDYATAEAGTDANPPGFLVDPELTYDRFAAMTANVPLIESYKPFIERRTLSDHETAQFYLYESRGRTSRLTIIRDTSPTTGTPPQPAKFDIILADPANGGSLSRHTLALEGGRPFFEATPAGLVTRVQRFDGGVDEITLPINEQNCEAFDCFSDSFVSTFDERPTGYNIADLSAENEETYRGHLDQSPQYSTYNRPHYDAGSVRNLISIEGDVGYIYLPRTKNNPPQYVRVMQKHEQMYINMTGLNPEKPEEPTTCQILGVSTEPVAERGPCLALELSYGGKRHNIVLPIQVDLQNNVNSELFYDLKALVNGKTIQLNEIQDWQRPEVKNYAYAPEMELPVRARPNEIQGSVSFGRQTAGVGARAGQKFSELQTQFNFNGVTYTGITQRVKLEGSPNLGPQQNMSLYNDEVRSTPVEGGIAEDHFLANVTRKRTFTNPDGSQTIEDQTVYTVLEREVKGPDGNVVRRSRTLLISASYMAEMQRNNPDFTITQGRTPNEQGFYEFPVQNVQVTADGELLYGLQVAGREVAIAANARGSQIITQEGGVQRRAYLANSGSPMDIGFGTRILEEIYTEGSNITFKPGSNSELIDGLLVRASVLARQTHGTADPVVEVGIPSGNPQIRLFSAKVVQKDNEGHDVEQAINFMERDNQLFVYAKVGRGYPRWTRVDLARLAVTGVEEGKPNQTSLILESGSGSSVTTMVVNLDFASNQPLLTAALGTQTNPGFMREALTRVTPEGARSQRAFWYQADGESAPSLHATSETPPPEGAIPVFEHTHQSAENQVVFDVLANAQTNFHDAPAPNDELPKPDNIEDPKTAEKPEEKEPEEWKPHPPMPNLRNCLIGGGLICVLLSVFIPGFAAVAFLFALGALTVEAQPWNAVGAARQERLARAKERIENSHKQIERQLSEVNERFENAKVDLAKVEQQLENTNLSPAKRRQLEERRERLQREIYRQQMAAQALQVSARTQAQWNLVRHQEDVIRTHQERQAEKQRTDYVRLRMRAREQDTEWRSAADHERAEFENLSQRDESTLTAAELERLQDYRRRFSTIMATEEQIAADEAADNEHLAQLQANLESLKRERDAADEELRVAEEAAHAGEDGRPAPPESEWRTIISANAGIANYQLRESGYDDPVPHPVQGREENEANASRAEEVDAFGRRRASNPRGRSSADDGRAAG